MVASIRPEAMPASAGRAVRRAAVPLLAAALATGCSSSPSTSATTATPAHTQAPTPAPAGNLPSAGTLSTVASGLGSVKQGETWGIGSDGTSVWIYNGDTGVVMRITAATGAVAATIQLRPGCAAGCGNLAVGNGAVWVSNVVDGSITRIDPATNTATAAVHLAANASPQVYSTPGAVWSANYKSDSYTRIDPRSGAVAATLSHHLSANGVAYVGGSVWLCDASGTPALTRLDPASYAVQKGFDVVSGGSKEFCFTLAPLGSSLYVIPDEGANPQVVDAATGVGTETAFPGDAQSVRGVVGGADGTWLLDAKLGVFRLDPASGRAAAEVAVAGGDGIADDGHSVWVISDTGTLYRVVPAGVAG